MPLPLGNIPRLFLASLVLLAGCSCSEHEEREGPPTAVMHPNTPMEIVRDPILFDADGKLRPSDTHVGALVIPIGFRAATSATGAHIFDGLVPIEAVQAFYRARLVSSDITQSGDYVRFARARPTTTQGISNERFDITIAPDGRRGVRITITPAPTPPPTISETEARRRINEALLRQSRD